MPSIRKSLTVASKECNVLFKSPVAYIVLFITISIFNFFFYVIVDQNREATLRDMFKLMEFLFVFIVPLLTMKTFAEEKRTGTIEFLLTSPVKISEIVLGKFLGSLFFFIFLLGLTIPYYGIIDFFSNPDRLTILLGYTGLLLEGALFIAVGLLISSWTKSQIVAAIGTYCVLLGLYFSIVLVKYLDGIAQQVLTFIGVWSHSENLTAGLILTEDIVYFLSGTVFCIILTRLSLDNKWWG